ncbi:hypothetical protein FV227_27250 [Methylobacterium sp. WL119]|uniref:hypothetical protein n=1 Tax=unclassified Methylobacterium TaxID=2615210 RepID=UPI0011C83280|nr:MULTISPECIES: hypothetical protein [unclassified Methylobacterium]TXN36635.1 hypothetical protein FV225_14095 [Methylobacterium sp. WL93]TXN43993.1 hypothetical protein FV227_27250 [Methylobacterium sp. WL119]
MIAITAVLLLTMLLYWTVSGRLTDIVSLIIFLYLGSNLFYLIFSHPTFKTSAFFQRAATGLAFASLELRHQAKEAELRETEAERLRNLDAGSKDNKLRAANEFLQYIRENPTIKKYYVLDRIPAAASALENGAIAAPPTDQRAITSPQSSVAPAPAPNLANPQLAVRARSLSPKGPDTAPQTAAPAGSTSVVGSEPRQGTGYP